MIYLDAAATTLEKPPQVRQAMAQAAAELSTPGRGSHPAARRAEETAFRCRAEAAALFGVPSPENVVFTMNATHGLNIAIRSLVVPGSRVVISGYEHNAVCRPLYAIPEVRLTVVDAPPFRREQAAEEFRRAILAGADAVIVNHVSTCSVASSRWRDRRVRRAGVCRWWTPPNRRGRALHLTELGRPSCRATRGFTAPGDGAAAVRRTARPAAAAGRHGKRLP
ncbi:MAG: aminotransferase class V-fold PLP-dependent enzyme [Oscillospiraceae bacterium]